MDWYVRTREYVAGCICAAVVTCSGVVSTGPVAMAQAATKAPATAQGSATHIDLEKTALGLAPSDAAFFHSSLNMRKGWKEIEEGWLAEVRRVPYVQQLEEYLQEQWNNPDAQAAQAKAYLQSPIVQDILRLLVDMTAQESFIYGDKDWADFLVGAAEIQTQVSALNTEDSDAVREYVMGLDKADIDAIPLPTTIVGFQLSDDANARTQLDALQGIVQLALGSSEELKPIAEGLKRKDLDNGQILSFTLEADDIPWQSLPRSDDEEIGEVIEHLAGLLEGRKAVISLAVIDNRLLMSLSENADTLLQMGQGESLLTNDTLKQLTDNEPDDIRSVTYTSGQWKDAAWASNFASYFERAARQISNAITSQAEDPEAFKAWQEKLISDCQWLDERVNELKPEFADSLAYSFVTSEGTESLGYDWTPSLFLENAKPLVVASHGGASPLILFAQRQHRVKEVSEIIDAIFDEVPAHVTTLIESGVIKEDDAEQVQEFMDEGWPIVEEMYATLRDEITPSLDGRECLTAVTAIATINQLSEDAPPPPEPLPLPEIGIVLKLKSKDQFLSGCDQFVTSLNKLLDYIREKNPDALPESAQIPPPDEESLPGGGTRYSYPSGAPAPFEQFQLQMAINKEVAVLGYSTRQVRDMYASRALATRPAWYSEKEPTAAVGFVDCAGIARAIKPWVHYALSLTGKELSEPLGPSAGEVPVPTGADILQIWDTFKKFGKAAGTTVIDKNDVTVSHWIWVGE